MNKILRSSPWRDFGASSRAHSNMVPAKPALSILGCDEVSTKLTTRMSGAHRQYGEAILITAREEPLSTNVLQKIKIRAWCWMEQIQQPMQPHLPQDNTPTAKHYNM